MKIKLFDIVIDKEKLSNNKNIFAAYCSSLRIVSQGYSMDDAIKNIREAIALYLEEKS